MGDEVGVEVVDLCTDDVWLRVLDAVRLYEKRCEAVGDRVGVRVRVPV